MEKTWYGESGVWEAEVPEQAAATAFRSVALDYTKWAGKTLRVSEKC